MAFAKSLTTQGSALHLKLPLAQVAELFTLAKIWEMSSVHLRMADIQILSSLFPYPSMAKLNKMIQ